MRLSRQNVLLLVLLALMGVLAWQRLRSKAPEAVTLSAARTLQPAPPRATGRSGPSGAPAATTGRSTAAAPTVHLAALAAEREPPGDGGRNPFRFGRAVSSVPAPVSGSSRQPPPVAEQPPSALPLPASGAVGQGRDSGPPPASAITLKFIGLVQRGDGVSLAVLSPGEGKSPVYGREGDIIEGRYRLVRIGSESLDIEYADGRGRQTLKLSGQ